MAATGLRASGKPEVIILTLTCTRLSAKEPGQGEQGPKRRTRAGSICPKRQLLLRDGMSLREQGVLSPTHPFFLPLLFLHSRRKPPRTPESWPETLSLLTQCPRVNLSIACTLLSCPLPCSLPGLQETRPQPDLLLNQPLPHSSPPKNRKPTANAQTLAIHRLALCRAAGLREQGQTERRKPFFTTIASSWP